MSYRDINVGRGSEDPFKRLAFRFPGGRAQLIVLGLLAFILLILFRGTFLFVDPTEMAAVTNKFSGQLSSRYPGFHILLPGVQEAKIYDVKEQTYTMVRKATEGQVQGDDSIQCLTGDGQTVYLDITVRFQPDPNRITDLHRRFGTAYIENVVRPQTRSIVRNTVSKHTIVDVYSGSRIQIQKEMADVMTEEMAKADILFKEVLVRDVNLTPEFQKAIEQKQIAQQEVQRKQYELERERVEKDRKVIEAEGEAKSITLKGDALAQNPALIQYEYVQKIMPGVQTIITDGRSILNLGDLVSSGKTAAKPTPKK